MAFTYDVTTNLGKVRLLALDTNASSYLFSDAEVEAFLGMNLGPDGSENVRLAAAEALETIAANEALVSKRIEILDLKVDGPAVAAALMKRAASLRGQEAGQAAFDIAEFADTPAQAEEFLYKQALREG